MRGMRRLALAALAAGLVTGVLLRGTAGASDAEPVAWNQQRVTELAAGLHQGVRGLRDEIRATTQDVGTMKGWAYYRLMDELRLLERETGHLHSRLEAGAGRDETRPTFVRIARVRRDCQEEMERLYLGSEALRRVARAREIVRQLNPYYGFANDEEDHQRVLGR